MKDYPRAAALFLILLSLAALASVLDILRQVPLVLNQGWWNLIAWVTFSILIESLSTYIKKGNVFISTVDGIFYAAYLSSGPVTALACIVFTSLLYAKKTDRGIRWPWKTAPRLILFNITHYIVSLWVIFRLHQSLTRLMEGLSLLPALICAPLFFLFSCLLNSYFYKVEERRNFKGYLKEFFLPHYSSALPASFAALIVAITYPKFGVLSMLFYLIPQVISMISMGQTEEHR